MATNTNSESLPIPHGLSIALCFNHEVAETIAHHNRISYVTGASTPISRTMGSLPGKLHVTDDGGNLITMRYLDDSMTLPGKVSIESIVSDLMEAMTHLHNIHGDSASICLLDYHTHNYPISKTFGKYLTGLEKLGIRRNVHIIAHSTSMITPKEDESHLGDMDIARTIAQTVLKSRDSHYLVDEDTWGELDITPGYQRILTNTIIDMYIAHLSSYNNEINDWDYPLPFKDTILPIIPMAIFNHMSSMDDGAKVLKHLLELEDDEFNATMDEYYHKYYFMYRKGMRPLIIAHMVIAHIEYRIQRYDALTFTAERLSAVRSLYNRLNPKQDKE